MLKLRRWWPAPVVALAVAAELLLFVTPHTDTAKPNGVVIVLGPSTRGDRYLVADSLAGSSRSLLIALSDTCPSYLKRRFRGYDSTICFKPEPLTTQGEARFASAYARRTGAHNITVITTADQVTRARLRFRRCWSGGLSVLAVPLPRLHELARVPYENGALLKALVLQRSC